MSEKAGEIEQAIEEERKCLEAEALRRESEAGEKLDRILDRKKMDFCSRCSRKLGARADISGKCWADGCGKTLCSECWSIRRFRYCKEHARGIHEDAEKPGPVAGAEPIEGLRAMLEGDDGSRRQKLDYLASEYAGWLARRLEKQGPIDWTPRKYLPKADVRKVRGDGETAMTVGVRRWFRRKVMLSVVVASFDPAGEFDASSITALLKRLSRRYGGYKLFVLVTDGAKLDVVNFANGFSDRDCSLYVSEPSKGNMFYNLNDPVTAGYSEWLSQKKEPGTFRVKLKRASDLVSGKLVVSPKSAAKEFGFGERDVNGILRSCPFITPLKGTDTFVWTEV